jgi:hypothetical protein
MPTWFATNTLVSNHQELNETSPGANATSSPATGWTVGTTAPTVYSEFDGGTKQANGTFSGTARPDGSINTAGDCLRTSTAYTGSFASANWTLTFSVIGVTNSGAQDGRARFRLFRSVNADGSSATEITGAAQVGSTVTNLSTTQQDSSVTFNPGAFSLSNEYLFVQVGWEITGAGGMSTTDVVMRIGTTATRVVSSTFTPSFTGTGTVAIAPLAFASSGAEAFTGTATEALAPLALDVAGAETFTGTATEALAPLALDGAGTMSTGFDGDATLAVAPLATSSSGAETFTGTAAEALAPLATAGTGAETFTGTGSEALAPLALSGAGAEAFTGTSGLALAPLALGASGAEAFAGTGALAVAPLAYSASGTYNNDKVGDVTFAVAPAAFGAAGTYTPLSIAGASALALAPLAFAGAGSSGALTFSGDGVLALAPLALASAGVLGFAGSTSFAVPPLAFSSAGGFGFSGSASVALAPLAYLLLEDGSIAITGTGTIALAPLTFEVGWACAPNSRFVTVSSNQTNHNQRTVSVRGNWRSVVVVRGNS